MTADRRGEGGALVVMFRHNRWANLKLLDFCAGLTDEQLSGGAVGAYGSIRATLRHIVYSEVDYVGRINGGPSADGTTFPVPSPDDGFPGFEVLRQAAAWSGAELIGIAASAQAAALVREEDAAQGVGCEYPLSTFLVQIINHATEHRTQISTIITQLGLEPPDMTGWAYMEEAGEFREFRL